MEKIATTRISDLPENITIQMPPGTQANYGQQLPPPQVQTSQRGQEYDMQNTTYNQMNVHPNPYGNTNAGGVMPLPQPTQLGNAGQNQFLPQMQNPENVPQYRLPSRDIPVDTTNYSHDEQVQANYIPRSKLTSDYIREYEEVNDIPLREYKQRKYREITIDSIITEFQTPIFIMLLYFIFQMPIVNTFLYKNFSFLSIYNSDGNANFYGLFLKSAIFGSMYYLCAKFTNYISEL